MAHNLVIDIGNTRTKVAVFHHGDMVYRVTTDTITIRDIKQLLTDFKKIKGAIVSSVREGAEKLVNEMNEVIPYTLLLDHKTPLPLENKYETPHTLGKDRIAAAVGANHLYKGNEILVIDAGTAITYDYINKKSQYMGGFITPGLNMRFKALYEFTDKLPLLKAELPLKQWKANTNDSIIGGIQLGLEGEIERIVKHFRTVENELIIILTGGDKNYFEKLLKNYKFVALEITLLGLNTILETNYTT